MTDRDGRIFLIGLMGSGKSTIGRRLSREIGWPYLDNDQLIRDVTGQAAPDLEAAGGVEALHAAETVAFERSLTLDPPVIVGVAAWVVTRPDLRSQMHDAGRVVWLRAEPETLLARAGTGQGRRADALSSEWIERVAAERAPWFASVADLVIDVDLRRPREVVGDIVDRLGLPSSPTHADARPDG
jgi:shikimate kinase